MEQKRVSFKVATALKDAGYPQEGCGEYFNKYGAIDFYLGHNIARPYVMEVWLWLWREKKCPISVEVCLGKWAYFEKETCVSNDGYIYNDPEEAIIAAIVYLCDNDLIK